MRLPHLGLSRFFAKGLQLVVAVYFASASPPAWAAQENIWVGTSSNLWDTASNWSLGHAPLATENVRIDAGAIVAENGVYFATLNLNGGALRLSGNLHGAQTTIAATATLTLATSNTIYLYGLISNHGTVVWESGKLEGGDPARWYACRIDNETDGTVQILSDGSFGIWAVFTNAGVLRKIVGAGTTSFARTILNSGTISLESGTLFAEYGINQSAGAIRLAGGQLRADDYTGTYLSGGELTGAGLITGRVEIQQHGFLRPSGNSGAHLQIDGSLFLHNNATTEISIPSSSDDPVAKVSVTGTLMCGGKLVFSFSDARSPNYSCRYPLFSTGYRTGGFDSTDLPTQSAGTYFLGVEYGDTAANLVISAPPYFNWRHKQFVASTDASIIGDNADPDSDGIPNLLEYAFGLNPLQPSHAGLPIISIESDPVDGTKHLTLTFRTPAEAVDTYFTPLTSSDLLTWSSDWWETDLISDTTTDGIRTQVIRDTTPVENSSRRFMRLKVAFSP